jgi:hypothetical protein
MLDQPFAKWIAGLEARQLAELTFPEVSRALRALSSTYVERRGRLTQGAALSGAGKRAAFALFYGPLHYLLVRHIVSTLPGATRIPPTLIDLGCGTGASGAAWASACEKRPAVLAVDRHPWAADQARITYREFGLAARTRVGDIMRTELPERAAVLAAFTVNEMEPEARDALMTRLMARSERGARVLIVEPLAGFVAPWWNDWKSRFEAAGGRADEWRLRTELPPIVQKLDRAAGLNHRVLTGRSLWL